MAVTTTKTATTTSSETATSSLSSQSKQRFAIKNPYREPYHIHKHLLLRRILYRILNDTVTPKEAVLEHQRHRHNQNDWPYDPAVVQQVMTDFILSWFHHPPSAAVSTVTTPIPISLFHRNPRELQPPQKLQPQSSNVSSLSEEAGTAALSDTTSHNSSNSRSTELSLSCDGDCGGGMEEDTGSISSTEELSPPTTTTNTATTTTTKPVFNNNENNSNRNDWTIPQISKSQMNDFLAWSMFNQHMNQMTRDDMIELQKCYDELHQVVQLVFYDDNDDEQYDAPPQQKQSSLSYSPSISLNDVGAYDTNESVGRSHSSRCSSATESSTCNKSPKPQPRRLCLENVNAWHRPLLIYFIVYIIRTVLTRLILQYGLGFQRIHSTKVPGVTGWYRPSKASIAQSRIPMIFFHGIAPAGVFFYLPMLLMGSDIITRDRCCLLVDNYNIACTLMFEAKSEQEMVMGVQDFIDTYFPNPATTPIAVCGHSFGSCVISWLFYHGSQQLQKQIQLCVLLDPVTILLSDPNVMNNFLYSRKVLCCIRMFASSELFTEYYLRHHFSWYNSELWLDEILPGSAVSKHHDEGNIRHVIVGLSECDEIVDAPKVKRHIDLFLQRQPPLTISSNQQQHQQGQSPQRQSLWTMYWKQAGHANCLQSQSKWRDIQRTIRECEYTIAQQQPKN